MRLLLPALGCREVTQVSPGVTWPSGGAEREQGPELDMETLLEEGEWEERE